MPEDIEFLPQTAGQTQTAVLAFASIVGGGLLAYHVGQGIKDGNLFKTTPVEPNPQAGFVALTAGLIMFGLMAKNLVQSVGWKVPALGCGAIFAMAAVKKASG